MIEKFQSSFLIPIKKNHVKCPEQKILKIKTFETISITKLIITKLNFCDFFLCKRSNSLSKKGKPYLNTLRFSVPTGY